MKLNKPIGSSAAVALAVAALLAGCGAGSPGDPQKSPALPAARAISDANATCPPPSNAAPDALSEAQLIVQDGHSERIRSLSASADGRIVASTSTDGTARVWDTTTGLLLRQFALSSYGYRVALDGAGKRLAFRAPEANNLFVDATMIVDLESGEKPIRAGFIGAFDLSRDGKWLAIGANLHDARTGEHVRSVDLQPKIGGPTAVAFDPSGRRLAAALLGEIVILNMPALDIALRFPQPGYTTPADAIYDMGFSDGALVVRNGLGPGTIDIIHPATGRRERSLPGRYISMSVARDRIWTVDQANRASGWNAATGAELPGFSQGARSILSVAASGDGRTLALASEDTEKNDGGDARQTITVQDTATLHTVRTLAGRSRGLSALSVHPGGKQMAAGYRGGQIDWWDLELGTLTKTTRQPQGILDLEYDPSGELVAALSTAANVAVRSSKTGKILRQWHSPASFGAFLPGTSHFLTVATDGVVTRWDLSPPHPPPPDKPLRFGDAHAEPESRILSKLDFRAQHGKAAISPDGQWLAVLGKPKQPSHRDEMTIAMVNTESGAPRWQTSVLAFNDVALSVAFAPDGARLFLSSEETPPGNPRRDQILPTLRVLDAKTGAILQSIPQSTTGPLAVRGDTLFIGGSRPVLLDAQTLAAKSGLGSAGRSLVAAVSHPEKNALVLANNGGTTWIQPLDRKAALATFLATADGDYVVAMPDGVFRSSVDGARSVAWTFSPPLEGFSFEQFSGRFHLPDHVRRRLAGEDVPGPPIRRPPHVVIEGSPLSVTSERAVSIRAKVSSPHRVDRVRVFVDGRSTVDKLVCAGEASVTLDVPLHVGRNRLSVMAYDAEGYSSNAKVLDVVSTAPGEMPDLWVVSIGVSRYPQMTAEQQLDVADDDARAITEALRAQAGPGRPFRRLSATTLLDADVTVESVERALSGLSAMRPEDLAIVFLAGHGARISANEMVYMTSRAAFNKNSAQEHGIGWSRIERRLAEARGRVLLLLDACHSGHLSTELVAPNDMLAKELAANNRAGVLIFAASRGSQFSYEIGGGGTRGSARSLELAWEERRPDISSTPRPGHGLFTGAVLEALAGAAPDRDRSEAIEVGEFIDYVTERVRSLSIGKQTPWVARREMFGDFVITQAKN